MLTFLKLGEYGRLGNQMFQIASTIGIAKKLGYQFGFPYWRNTEHLVLFNSSEDIDVQKYFKNPLPGIPGGVEFKNTEIPWGFHDIHLPDENLSLAGHMQSEKYFRDCKELVRFYFDYSDEVKNSIPAITGDNTCCVLFRRGDYVKKSGYHPLCTREYYEKAMAEFPADTKWIVFPENNIEECREIIGNNAEYIDSGIHYVLRQYLMGTCANFIMPNGTYGWFSAWLGTNPNKKVISPSEHNWFGPEANGLSAHDVIPEDWVQIRF